MKIAVATNIRIHQRVVEDKSTQGHTEDKMMTRGMTKAKLSIIIVINLATTPGNAKAEFKKISTTLKRRTKVVSPHYFWHAKQKKHVKGILDATKIHVKGKGNILIRLKNGKHEFISNVYYVPDMKNNILSLGQLLEKGYNILMNDYSLSIRDRQGNLIVKVPMMKNRMFMLNIQTDVAKHLKSCLKDSSWAWHLRLGHLNFGGLRLMAKKNMVNGLPYIKHPNQFCE
ncbi:hypothetical protein EZV62_019261 [Acer yangbiense]|uniref:Uncharacterized protein n=1 Tax=Acer yangbiense TaxID=1000413 RepID=A0A5C7HBT8_9ROSI|nr:hypothetical protein EZV62_019261 [Acer yangbiense]